jgi:hypothetical protein
MGVIMTRIKASGFLILGFVLCASLKTIAAGPDVESPKVDNETVAPMGAVVVGHVAFANLKNGDKVKSPVKVKMTVVGLKVRPAGEDVNDVTSGHHHILVDSKPTPAGQIILADEKNIHFGKGQTETEVKLAPGDHTLTLQFADGAHRSYGEKMSATVSIKVIK